MSTVRSRRTRLSYSVELERAHVAPDQTPIERVHENQLTSLSTKQRDGILNSSNVRLTPFKHERTDYTYGDSASYRTDRLKAPWVSPEMSRPPLYSQTGTSGIDTSHSQTNVDDMRSKTANKRQSSVTKTQSHSSGNAVEIETSSRSSVSSSRSSTRPVRSRCHRVQGDWCTHVECASTTAERRMTFSETVDQQRNSNNIMDHVTTPETPQSIRRRSGRIPRSTITDVLSSSASSKLRGRSPSSRLAGTSSSYIYTYTNETAKNRLGSSVFFEGGDVPGSNSTHLQANQRSLDVQAVVDRFRRSLNSNNAHSGSGSWFTRHIFGLEGAGSGNGSSYFASSDVDDADAPVGSSTSLRHRRIRSSRFTPSERQSTASKAMNIVKTMPILTLTLFLTLIYSCCKFFAFLIRKILDTARQICFKLFGSSDSFTSEKLIVHPRLVHFDSRFSRHSPSSSDVGSDLLTRSVHCATAVFSWLRSVFLRMLALLCLLIPLLFLLAFLLAPVALDNYEVDRKRFISDAECQQILIDPLPTNASSFQIARWRFRCLYRLVRPTTDDDGASDSSSLGWFAWFRTWFSPSATTEEESVSWQPDLSGDGKLVDQFSSLSRLVDQRLKQLADSLKLTDTRLSQVQSLSEQRIDNVVAQLNTMQTSLDKYALSLDAFRTELTSSQTGSLVEERLLQTLLTVVNQTIASKLNTIRLELEQVQPLPSANLSSESVQELHALLGHLRQQLFTRVQEAEDRLFQLNTALRTDIDNQSSSHVNLLRSVDNLRMSVDQLTEQLTRLKQAQVESTTLINDLKLTTRQCSEAQATQAEQCKQIAVTNTQNAILELSDKLKAQINDLVQEAVLKQMDQVTTNTAFHSQLKLVVQKTAQEMVEKTLKDKTLGTSIDGSLDQVMIQKLIDKALEKFAADRTGMPDFALESAGGSIVSTRCTRTYTEGAALFKLFGIPLARLSNSARTILQLGNNPGDCWPFHGSSGQVVVRLSKPIIVTAVSLEHLALALAPNGHLDSAPREFQIKGLTSAEAEEGVVLGTFVYSIEGPPIQTFELQNQSLAWQYIELAILSNHGNPQYTCVYRLRIHGKPVVT